MDIAMLDNLKTSAVIAELVTEAGKLNAETGKLHADTVKLNHEARWPPYATGAGLCVAAVVTASGLVKLFS
jgi:hypothetical protein